jgi:hypothetical protein
MMLALKYSFCIDTKELSKLFPLSGLVHYIVTSIKQYVTSQNSADSTDKIIKQGMLALVAEMLNDCRFVAFINAYSPTPYLTLQSAFEMLPGGIMREAKKNAVDDLDNLAQAQQVTTEYREYANKLTCWILFYLDYDLLELYNSLFQSYNCRRSYVESVNLETAMHETLEKFREYDGVIGTQSGTMMSLLLLCVACVAENTDRRARELIVATRERQQHARNRLEFNNQQLAKYLLDDDIKHFNRSVRINCGEDNANDGCFSSFCESFARTRTCLANPCAHAHSIRDLKLPGERMLLCSLEAGQDQLRHTRHESGLGYIHTLETIKPKSIGNCGITCRGSCPNLHRHSAMPSFVVLPDNKSANNSLALKLLPSRPHDLVMMRSLLQCAYRHDQQVTEQYNTSPLSALDWADVDQNNDYDYYPLALDDRIADCALNLASRNHMTKVYYANFVFNTFSKRIIELWGT